MAKRIIRGNEALRRSKTMRRIESNFNSLVPWKPNHVFLSNGYPVLMDNKAIESMVGSRTLASGLATNEIIKKLLEKK